MRSMFSNRYDKKRNEFYDNYEARELHPSLPLYERPVEPDELMAFTPSGGRRLKSYRQMANHSREQLLSDSWLSSHTLPIAVRRNLELRIQSLLMPRYDPTVATHEFSHNGIPRRGRPPSAATMAKFASNFAVQVGGIPCPINGQNEDEDEDDSQETDDSKDSERIRTHRCRGLLRPGIDTGVRCCPQFGQVRATARGGQAGLRIWEGQ
ncbi:uncharacterized protein LOC128260934 isoform X2 [Drosophila gunungcola]|uniref:uncharacterized protein LOC128260934 isoform X2 n=1 Tax=Drosophila gunungcola TaxID=103775 RepID=UPI0022E66525|nr:uncharacterized protein LOC128260934 isoform X2 [Drosophila gunungcola]